ncbi:MAG: carboxypeptidase-like regulatory domain-containing protein, partial [bacterium]
SKEGYYERTKSASILPFRGLRLDFPLIPIGLQYASIKGEVRDKSDNSPIPDCLVMAYNSQSYFFSLTDCDGYYEIENIPEGRYRIVAIKEGYKSQSRWEYLRGEKTIDFILQAGKSVLSFSELLLFLEDPVASSIVLRYKDKEDIPIIRKQEGSIVLSLAEDGSLKINKEIDIL